MKLDTILGDLIYAHLDPDHSLLWNKWESNFQLIIASVENKQARKDFSIFYTSIAEAI